MNKLSKNETGFIRAGSLLVIFILVLAAGIFYVFYHDDSHTKTIYKTITPTSKPSATYNPYADWRTYSSNKLSLRYPSDWSATDSDNPKILAYATSADFSATSAGVSVSGTNGSSILLQVQVSAYSGDNFCSDITCQVTAVAPLSNTQLNNDVLAVINETFQARKTTVYAVVNNSIKVGDTAVELANADNGLSIFGQPEYSSPSTSSTAATSVSDVSSFQSSIDFTDLVLLINSIKFN
jgi:hypothetical protein